MKLTFIFLTSAFLQVSAKGDAQNVTYSGKNVKLQTVFDAVEQQTGYAFFYNDADLKKASTVTVDLKSTPLQEALPVILKGQPFTYTITGKTIVISQRTAASEPADSHQNVSRNEELPKKIDVHGRIVNENGEPFDGATVTVKGTTNATSTDANGEFALKNVEENSTLIFTGVNIETVEVKLNGRTDISLVARSKVVALQNVQVNKGYYSLAQKQNTGNVTKVTSETIEKQPVSDVLMALEGRVPGLYIAQESGVPGSRTGSLQLRGRNSIANGNDPLILIDGIPFPSTTLTSFTIGGGAVYMDPLNAIDPATIESVEVLKDADATAIYGSRGANGVILITTKRGKAGKPRVDVNFYASNGTVERKLDLLNTQQYLAMRSEAFKNDGLPVPSITTNPTNTDYDVNGVWDASRYTDWQKVLIGGTSHITNSDVTLSGGTNNTQYSLTSSYRTETTVFPGDWIDKKASVFFNLNQKSANQKLNVQFSAGYVNDNSVMPPVDFSSLQFILLPPDAPAIYNPDGSLNWQIYNGTNTWNNPFANLLKKAKAVTDNLIGNLSVSYKIANGLTIRSNLGYNKIEMNQAITTPATAYSPTTALTTIPLLRSNAFGPTTTKSWIWEPQINYQKETRIGKFDLLVGATFQQNLQTALIQTSYGFSSDALINNPQSAPNISVANYTNTDYRYNAFFGRIGYNYKDKYLLNFTGRRDGSSRFGPDNRFGNFGAIGAGWVFSNESFLQKQKALSYGKLRFSYGTTGNDQLGAGDFQYLATYTSYSNPYLGATGLTPNNLGNPFYQWESVTKIEGGLELGFIQDKINFIASVYRNRTGNQLVGYSLPAITGFSTVIANLPAVVENSGVEFEFSTTNIKTKNFLWTTSGNLTIPRNKLVSYPNLQGSSYANTYQIGSSLFIRKTYESLGVDPTTGLYTFLDVNKDGTISFPQDYVGNKQIARNYFGGLQNSFSFKNFQLDVFIQFVKQTGSTILGTSVAPGLFPSTRASNQPTFILSDWQNPGDIASIQKFTQNTGSSAYLLWANFFRLSDATVSDASFIRCKNVSLSYQMPQSWKHKIGAQAAKIFIEGQNLFTITKFQGLDPEVGNSHLPPLRVVAVGVKLSF